MANKVSVFWFRRDLRIEDNVGLFYALKESEQVIPIFIFDENILSELPANDARVNFIYDTLEGIHTTLTKLGSSLKIYKGNPIQVWKNLLEEYTIERVYTNKDYEPYAIQRDQQVEDLLKEKAIELKRYKDQVIFEENEVLKDDGTPYTVYTPFKNKWLSTFKKEHITLYVTEDYFSSFHKNKIPFPSKESLGIEPSTIKVKEPNFAVIENYDKYRNYPFMDKTSYVSPHLRFGTISVRKMVAMALKSNETYLSELIWREFFMIILFHFPKVVSHNFKEKYDGIQWRNDKKEFELWCEGKTGYPMVDAGMRELNETGYMHNRVRMVVAGFLCKHLLIDWRWGEAYFAKKLLDYDLSANNGNWQWAAGTGCDAAPYFRVFNPTEQIKKFDSDLAYIQKWVNDYNELSYPQPMVEHKMARERAINTYKEGLQ